MVRELRERWKALLFSAVVVASAGGLFAAAAALTPTPAPGEIRSVTLRVEGPGWSLHYEAASTWNHTAFALLREAADRLGFSVTWTRYAAPLDSVLVESIHGVRSGEGGRWWLYWVDGQYGDVGADRKVLGDGSEVLWAFSPYPPEAS